MIMEGLTRWTFFFLILLHVILPVFSLIGIGVFLHRKFTFDMGTLSKLNSYLLLPAVGFANVYESKMGGDILLQILSFLVLQSLCLIIITIAISKLFKFEKRLSSTFKNSVVLINSGNFGLPVSQLVFQHNPLGSSIQIVVMVFQNLLTYTYGLFNSVLVASNKLQAMKAFFIASSFPTSRNSSLFALEYGNHPDYTEYYYQL